MSKFLLCGIALFAMSGFLFSAHAGDAGGGSGPGGGPPGGGKRHNPIDFILSHATDLGLTDDQTSKLKELQKNMPKHPPKGEKPPDGPPPIMEKVKEILTPDQMDKLKDLMDKAHPGGPKPPKNDATK